MHIRPLEHRRRSELMDIDACSAPDDFNDEPEQHAERQRKQRPSGRARNGDMPSTPGRSTPAPKKQNQNLGAQYESCPSGAAYYKCANGFTGCCQNDPCGSGASCSTTQNTSGQSTNSASSNSQSTTASNSTTDQSMGPRTNTKNSRMTSLTQSSRTTTEQATGSNSQLKSASAPTPPACPAGNQTVYEDPSNIEYVIHCDLGNTFEWYSELPMTSGGYGACFSACSKTSECAGFTYLGLQSGHCYLKAQMPKDLYVVKPGRNFVSCSKVNPGEVAGGGNSTGGTNSTTGESSSGGGNSNNVSGTASKPPITAIVGGVVGGVAFLALLLFLIALIARRRRKKIEQRRATVVTHVAQGPIETTKLSPSGHQKSMSTSNDVFEPFGGYSDDMEMGDLPILLQTHSGARSAPQPSSPASPPIFLPASTYRPLDPHQHTWYDSSSVSSPRSQYSGSRSPRFHEHLTDLDDRGHYSPASSTRGNTMGSDSPTLGRLPYSAQRDLRPDPLRFQQYNRSPQSQPKSR